MMLTKHQRIRSDLRAKITSGIYGPGTALPSQNQLMSEYGVAQGTVRQALERLQADGLIVSHRGKGTFVSQIRSAEKSASAAASMGLMVVSTDQNDTIVNDQLLRFEQAAAKRSYDLAVRVFDPSAEEAAAKWATRHTGTVIWGAARRELVDRLLARGLPIVVMGELLDGDCPHGASWIRFDPDALVSMALQLMAGMGHRRVWFLNRGSSAYFRTLSHTFAQQQTLLGLDETCREIILERPEDEPSLVEHLESASEKPTALLIEGDIRACRIIHVLQQSEWLVPQRMGVVALGASEASRLGVHDLFRVVSQPDIGVVRAAEALAEMIQTGRIVRHVVAPRLVVGRTCAMLESLARSMSLQ